MAERTRRPPTDSPSETLARQEHEPSAVAPATAQAEAADRMRNSPGASAQRKTRDMMVNGAATAALRKTAQGMRDSTTQRFAAALPDATMAESTMADATGLHQALQTTAAAPDAGQNPEPSPTFTITSAPVQRALKVKGDEDKREALFKLLGDPAGLKFKWDAESELVTITEEVKGDPASPTLRATLQTVINSNGKTAQLDLSSERKFLIGNFGKWQELDVPALTSIETQVKGAGATMAIHEIWENYMAQGAGKNDGLGDYEPAHDAAKQKESLVATELSGLPSDRVADATNNAYVTMDYNSYYLVLHKTTKATARAARKALGDYSLTHYADGAHEHTKDDDALVKGAYDKLLADDMSTARIEGFRKDGEDAGLSLQRAKAVIGELKALDDDDVDEQRYYAVDGKTAADTVFVKITVTTPDFKFEAKKNDAPADS